MTAKTNSPLRSYAIRVAMAFAELQTFQPIKPQSRSSILKPFAGERRVYKDTGRANCTAWQLEADGTLVTL